MINPEKYRDVDKQTGEWYNDLSSYVIISVYGTVLNVDSDRICWYHTVVVTSQNKDIIKNDLYITSSYKLMRYFIDNIQNEVIKALYYDLSFQNIWV